MTAEKRHRLHRHLHSDDGWKKKPRGNKRETVTPPASGLAVEKLLSLGCYTWMDRTPVGAERVEWSCVGQRPCVDRPGGRRAAIGRVGAGEKEGEPPKT